MMKGERTKKAKMKEMAGVTETMTMIAPVKIRKMKRGRGESLRVTRKRLMMRMSSRQTVVRTMNSRMRPRMTMSGLAIRAEVGVEMTMCKGSKEMEQSMMMRMVGE